MKINICDVCHKENKITKAQYRAGYRHSIKVDLCSTHRDFIKGLTKKEGIIKILSVIE